MGTIKDSGETTVMNEKQVTDLIINYERELEIITDDIKNYTKVDKRLSSPLEWIVSKHNLISRINSLKLLGKT